MSRRWLQQKRRPHDGKNAYWCRNCQRKHLRWTTVGILHKAYFEANRAAKAGAKPPIGGAGHG